MLQRPEFNLGDNSPAASLGKDALHCEGGLHHLQPFGGKKSNIAATRGCYLPLRSDMQAACNNSYGQRMGRRILHVMFKIPS